MQLCFMLDCCCCSYVLLVCIVHIFFGQCFYVYGVLQADATVHIKAVIDRIKPEYLVRASALVA